MIGAWALSHMGSQACAPGCEDCPEDIDAMVFGTEGDFSDAEDDITAFDLADSEGSHSPPCLHAHARAPWPFHSPACARSPRRRRLGSSSPSAPSPSADAASSPSSSCGGARAGANVGTWSEQHEATGWSATCVARTL